jgi:trk system potassium uptake protein TrkH
MACAQRGRTSLSLQQGFLLTSASWIVLSGFAALPMVLGAPYLGVTDGYFEAMSAMTTTGATVIAGLDALPRSVLLWRGMLQWIGGMGVVLMAIIMLPVLGVGGMQLARTSDFNTLEKIAPRARDLARSFGWVYLTLTAACALGYSWSGMSGFEGVVHAMTTIATGGMSTHDASFGGFGPAAQYVGTGFMLLGGMSFVRFVQLGRGQYRPLFADVQIRAFLAIYAVLCLGVLAARMTNGDQLDEPAVREVAFNMASILTTTGYASTDYTLWGSLAVALIFCAGMIRGCSGSTSGGPKVFRYQILASAVASELRRFGSPNAVATERHQGRLLTPEVLSSVMAFFMVFFLTLGVSSVLLVLIGLSPITAISGAAACLSSIGPGLGPEIGPAGNFAGLPGPAKWLMDMLMLVGRLELLTVYVLFLPAFWRS